ncbi:hypothetical protein NDU88_004351 [Pleurodeles waltl]|uniref:Uncharacterized protein n=1 Tax=Pleurodeles waltl TaxID=8319 RepID=A0AAV7WVM3_PLEWA|nr:hypothetical protein NDU88_004351 [Pleurodeles waltl]
MRASGTAPLPSLSERVPTPPPPSPPLFLLPGRQAKRSRLDSSVPPLIECRYPGGSYPLAVAPALQYAF